MKIKITEEGCRVDGEELEVGSTITVKGDELPASFVNKAVAVDGDDDKAFVTNPAKTEPAALKGPFTIGDGVSGWYPVLDADGKAVKKLRKDDAEAFGTLSDDDKLAFLSE